MGDEIARSEFSVEDFERYRLHLQRETELLSEWFKEEQFVDEPLKAGFELEAWLIDKDLEPAPINTEFLERLNNPLASPELALFNVEINSTPRTVQDHFLSAFHDELTTTWRDCIKTAASLDAKLCAIGILPTVKDEDLNLANMSHMTRYRALNKQVLRMRKGKPIVIDINGVEHLRVIHRDVMLESAATSFQIHLQVPLDRSVRYFNTAMVLAAPMVALCANSPYLFGKELWSETRIPLFEQAVPTGGFEGAAFGPIRRVTFGNSYVKDSIMECFQENLDHYPVMLPEQFEDEIEAMRHVRLHNGTIWRWNRPLIGFDALGKPHLRLEHRVVPSGPSIPDTIANAAFFYGVCAALATDEEPIYEQLDFVKSRDNFYNAARLGLRAMLDWEDGWHGSALELLQSILLPLAKKGLEQLGVAQSDIQEYLSIIDARLVSGINGSAWQQAFVKRNGHDMYALTAAYLERQQSGSPVHEWTI